MDIVDFNQLNLEQITITQLSIVTRKNHSENINKEQLRKLILNFLNSMVLVNIRDIPVIMKLLKAMSLRIITGITAGVIDYFVANEASFGFTGSSYESANFYNSANIYSEGGELLTTTNFYDMLQKGWFDQIYTSGWDNDRSLGSIFEEMEVMLVTNLI